MSYKKIFRYYYWFLIEFFKKNSRLILLSFFTSLIGVIAFLSLSPYFKTIFVKKEIIGIVGDYQISNPPEEITKKISNGLVTVDSKGEIIPVLASSWEIKNNGLIYRFHLKDNLYWNDNKEFSAHDLKYQFNDVEVKSVDKRTIDFVLKKSLGTFPIFLDKPIIRYPLVGVSGLYRVGRIKSNFGLLNQVDLIPNLKNLNPITYRFYKNESQLVNAYKRGEITEMKLTKKSVADSFSAWKNSIVIKEVDYQNLLTIFFNFNNHVFNNKNFREALSLLIDVNKLTQLGEIAKGPIPPNSWSYYPALKTYNYYPETAKKIFEKESITTSSATLNFVTFYDYYEIANDLVNQFKEAGLPVNLQITSTVRLNDFDFLMAFWKVPTDPDQYFFWHSTQKSSNIGNYKNDKVDLLLEKGRSTYDIEKRKKYYFDFQKTIANDPPALFLYYPYVYIIKRK